jgi:hypothetical protein
MKLTIRTAEDIAAQTLAASKAQAQAAMLAQINAFLRRFTEGVPVEEVASWATKAAAARAYLDGQPAPMIEAEAALTGEDPQTLAATIVAKADAYTAIVARVTGLRRATNAAIAAAETEAAVSGVIGAARVEAKAMAQAFGLDFP